MVTLFYLILFSMSIILEHIGEEISGKVFNQAYPNIRLIKLTNKKENHNGFQFKNGLNIDNIEFNPKEECLPGGIYFVTLEEAHKWIYYGYPKYNFMVNMRKVTIPDDARVYVEWKKFKADKIILGPKSNISKEIYLNFVKYKSMDLEIVPQNLRDKDICIEAVKQNGWSLMYVPEIIKDIDICVEAVKQCSNAIHFVPINLREYVKNNIA